MPEICLYHPWIEPPYHRTVASLMLYWDQLQTIVPSSIATPYRRLHNRNAVDLGFLRPRVVSPEMASVVSAGDQFVATIDDPAVRAEARRCRKSRRLKDVMTADVHREKLSHELRYRILGEGSGAQDDWVGMSHGFASSYMTVLAGCVAAEDGSAPVTDRPTSLPVSLARIADTSGAKGAEGVVALLSLNCIHINNTTPLVRIMRFRDKHHDALLRYRKAVRTASRSVSGARPPEILIADAEALVRDELTPTEVDLSGYLRDHNIDFGLAALQIAVSTLTGGLVGGWPSALGGAGVSAFFTAVNWRVKADRAHQRDALGYLVAAKRTFGTPRS
ncbi:MAG: hypothetical protein KF745_02660 [Phycisphaeraceae bacterium]|nr:hypothetical protein [Phycisphaeraceae bacterium]